MRIYEGYFNDKEADTSELTADIEQSVSRSNNSDSYSDYDYTIVIELNPSSEGTIKTSPEKIIKTIEFIKYLFDNHTFISEYSDNIHFITKYRELSTTDIPYDTLSETIYGIIFAITPNANNPINILKFFHILYNTIQKKFFGISGIDIYPKNSAYKSYIDDNELKELTYASLTTTQFKHIYHLVSTFKNDLSGYKKLTVSIKPRLLSTYNDYMFKECKSTLQALADYTATKFYVVRFPKEFIKRINECLINPDVLKDKDTDFKITIDDPHKTAISYVSDPNAKYALINDLRFHPRKINDIIFKQYDNYRRLMIYIYTGPVYSVNNKSVYETAIYMGEYVGFKGFQDEIAKQLSDLTYNNIKESEIRQMLKKHLKPDNSV